MGILNFYMGFAYFLLTCPPPPPPFHADGVPRPACNTNSSQRGENDDVKGSGVVLGPVVLGERAAGVWFLTPKIDRATWPFLKFDRATYTLASAIGDQRNIVKWDIFSS